MNKLRDQRQKMLADTLDGDWCSGTTAQIATHAAAHARRRRASRRVIRALTSAAMLGVVAFLGLRFGTPQKIPPSPAPETVPAPVPARGYTVISDQELIDSPAPLLILPDEMGGKKIVLLDY